MNNNGIGSSEHVRNRNPSSNHTNNTNNTDHDCEKGVIDTIKEG